MAGYILGLYSDFSCLADRCPATCCSGWKIVVDAEAYQRFAQISDKTLRQDIMGNIVEQEGEFHFANRPNGDCAMLDEDGLCRIQRCTEESVLCNTCRKFPRISADLSNRHPEMGVWLSFAASCPVVAEYIIEGKVAWLYMDEMGRRKPLSAEQYKTLAEMTGYSEQANRLAASQGFCKDVARRPMTRTDRMKLWEGFTDIAVETLDILIQFPGFSYLDGSFDLYDSETPDLEKIQSFLSETWEEWKQFVQHYSYYRYPSRYLEFPEETKQDRTRQVEGELLVMRVMLCSRYCMGGSLQQIDWMEIVHWVYRFCVHGERMAKKVHAMFISWNVILLQMLY